MVMPLLFGWIAGEWVADSPTEPVGVMPTIDVIINGEPPGGVVVRYVVNRTADVGVEDVIGGLKIDVVVEVL
jgi:hypothetical protein